MTSVEIRQSFLDFFKSKGHAIVPSSSLMPDSPNLLFTNAGMNQFVPIFLGQIKCPYAPGRAADTQKCIRAGGKHNDLEDVGLDTYHHTFFEMLGNWSFGDYFKKEAIEWAWELVTVKWGFPAKRLYATVYSPDKAKGEPSDFDQEAYDFWAAKFTAAGLDPKVHIVNGNKKDNFWMMGETGPCGPCSEIHVDLTPAGDTKGSLVNKGDARCIEIWNLVFIQFNANPDGTFSPLPAKHVDTGMGFERVTGIIQNTKNFTDFSRTISNYETDIFRPIFDKIEKLSGKQYKSTLPKSGTAGETDQEKIDIAFRVIADHIRTLSFAIADGILPGNNDRNYVLRRILRRAVRYGRTLGFHEPFFYKLVDVLAETMGDIFPEIRAKKDHVKDVISTEEESFNKTLVRGIAVFEEAVKFAKVFNQEFAKSPLSVLAVAQFPADKAFELYDTYGFPLDLTELMARESCLTVDTAGFEKLMDEQRARARAAQKKEIITASNIDTSRPTRFVGFEQMCIPATILDTVTVKDKIAVTFDASPLYAEMGGQVGDTGEIQAGGKIWRIVNTQKTGNTFLHFIAEGSAGVPPASVGVPPTESSPQQTAARDARQGDRDGRAPKKEAPALPNPGDLVQVTVDIPRRHAIERHHSVTHLLHWALHEVVSADATQKGSYVGPDKLTFDFSSAALDPDQVAGVERLVNERILENAGVTWTEVPYAEVKGRKDIMQFFGEKYGDMVRVVQIGGKSGGLDGYSMELCGGTHTRATGEVGLFRILSESAVAAGIRRIEAVAGLRAYDKAREDAALISSVAGKVNSPVAELEKRVESLLAQQKDLEKQLKSVQQKQAAELARGLAAKAQTLGSTPAIIENLGAVDGDFLQSVADALKGQFKGVVVLGGTANNAVALVASVSSDFTKTLPAGKILQAIAPLVGGRGGGKPDNARGGGKDVSKLDEALKKAGEMLNSV
jgi:alanyl-tRNA synthetase